MYNQNQLPSSLSNKKLIELFERMHKGDEKAKVILIEHNLRLVAYVINKYFYYLLENNPIYSFDDLMSIGSFGLIKAVNTFDINLGYKFSSYATRNIINCISTDAKSTKKYKSEISTDEVISENKSGNQLLIKDTIESDQNIEEQYIEKEIIRELKNSMKLLTEREKMVLKYRYGLKGTKILKQKEISEILKTASSYSSQIEKNALEKISNYFKSIGLKEEKEFDTSLDFLKPNQRAYFLAKLVIDDGMTPQEISEKYNISTMSIAKTISTNLPVENKDLYERYVKVIDQQRKTKKENIKKEKVLKRYKNINNLI